MELKFSLSIYTSHISIPLNASFKLSYCKRASEKSSITVSQSLDKRARMLSLIKVGILGKDMDGPV